MTISVLETTKPPAKIKVRLGRCTMELTIMHQEFPRFWSLRDISVLKEPGQGEELSLHFGPGEEMGLLGSSYFAEHPLLPLTNIMAYLNLIWSDGFTKTN